MRKFRRSVALLAVVAGFAASSVAPAQSPDREARVDSAIATFDEAIRSGEYEKIWSGLEALVAAYSPALNEKEQARIVAAMSKGLRIFDREGGVAIRTAQALGEIGPDAAKPLSTALRDRRIARDESLRPVYAAVIRALGRTRSVRDVKGLTSLLSHDEPYIVVAAAEGLSHYREVRQSVRKQVAEALVRTLESAHNSAVSHGGLGGYEKRYAIVGQPLMDAIARVTGAQAGSPTEWRTWFNENKKKNWD
jgi:hypothetical protein